MYGLNLVNFTQGTELSELYCQDQGCRSDRGSLLRNANFNINVIKDVFFSQLHNLWYIQYMCILAITKEKSRRHTTSTSCVMGLWCIATGIIISVTLNPVLYKHTRTGINPLYMKRWCWWLMGPGHWLVNGSNELRCDPSNFDINHTNFLSA